LSSYRDLKKDVFESLAIKNNQTIVDIGCGTGNYLEHLKGLDIKKIGIDGSKVMLDQARKKLLSAETELILADLNKQIPLKNEIADVVICINVLYTLQNPKNLLAEIYRILKYGGTCILVNPIPSAGLVPHLKYHVHKSGFLNLILFLPSLFFLGLANFYIVLKGRTKKYSFFDFEKILSLVNESGLKKINVKKVYAGQAFMLTLYK
jgi:ubiquinone/menaquinone biosynthesis C-methylase UbiE